MVRYVKMYFELHMYIRVSLYFLEYFANLHSYIRNNFELLL